MQEIRQRLAAVTAALEDLEGTQAWGPAVERALDLARAGLTELEPPPEPESNAPRLDVYDGELVLLELARMNEELELRGKARLAWPGIWCSDLAFKGHRVALLYAGGDHADQLETECFDGYEAAEAEEAESGGPGVGLRESDLRRLERYRLLRDRVKPYYLGRVVLGPAE